MPDDYIFRFFEKLPRQGPGTDDQTLQALDQIRLQLVESPFVLDLGCGNGAQTSVLTKSLTSAFITAVDLYYPYLDFMRSRCNPVSGFAGKTAPCQASMLQLPFKPGSFDLVWSEGAIYVAGFREGLDLCHNLLRRQGFFALTEVTWLTSDRPQEVTDFWQNEYPAICTIEECRLMIQEAGFRLISDFILPEYSWYDNFYLPARTIIGSEMAKTRDQSEIDFLSNMTMEIDTYDKYKPYYGYVFFIMQRND